MMSYEISLVTLSRTCMMRDAYLDSQVGVEQALELECLCALVLDMQSTLQRALA